MRHRLSTSFLLLVGLVWLLGGRLASAAGENTQPVEPLDLDRLEQPLDPQLSPDGRTVAVVRQLRDIQTDRVRSELWLVAAEGGARRLLVGADRSPSAARWSPLQRTASSGNQWRAALKSCPSGRRNCDRRAASSAHALRRERANCCMTS